MKNHIIKTLILSGICFLLSSNVLLSYGNVYAHPAINKAIVEKFISKYLNYPEFKNYSVTLDLSGMEGTDVTESGNFNVTTAIVSHTAKEWIIRGGYSADEPEIPAALRHFYDPKANYENKKYLTDLNDKGVVNPQVDAINWHFYGNSSDLQNEWTWNAGKNAMEEALEEANTDIRESHLAKAFRCLGEVLHNTADMFCPPHVRNDAHGGWLGVGGSDPYESIFKPAWVDEFKNGAADPQLAAFLSTADKAIEINKKAAEFTNKYFFSDETISGTGVEQYSSRNKFPNYDSPKLEKMIYTEEDFTYTFTFPSERKVRMCNDQSLFLGFISSNFRSYPRVKESNVKSQASELVPNIIAAGARVIKNFIPLFEITVESNLKDKKLNGEVKHIISEEYLTQIGYNGDVEFFVNGKIAKFKANAIDGKFELISEEFKANDKIQAYISFADITVKSNEIKVEDNAQYEIQNFKFPQGSLVTNPKTMLGYHNDKYWYGESTTQTFTFHGSINAPAGTEIRPIEYYNNNDMNISIFCKNDKEIDVNLVIMFNSSPEEWTWYGTTGMDTVAVPFKFEGYDYKLEDNRPEEEKEIELPKISTVNFDDKTKELTISFKFDPKYHFAGSPITEGLHVQIKPKITCYNFKDYNFKTEDGYIIGTSHTSYYFSINFWENY